MMMAHELRLGSTQCAYLNRRSFRSTSRLSLARPRRVQMCPSHRSLMLHLQRKKEQRLQRSLLARHKLCLIGLLVACALWLVLLMTLLPLLGRLDATASIPSAPSSTGLIPLDYKTELTLKVWRALFSLISTSNSEAPHSTP